MVKIVFLNLEILFIRWKCDTIPPATYTVLSGHGLHLYYIFDEPIELRPHMIDGIQRIKDGLTELVWNDFTSSIKVTIEKPICKTVPINFSRIPYCRLCIEDG